MNPKPTIAVFDFDGTITVRDSFLDFIRFTFGNFRYLVGFLRQIPSIIVWRMGLMSSERLKTIIFIWFFRGMSGLSFHDHCKKYDNMRLGYIIRSEALAKINWHRERGHRLVIASASIKDWISPWAVANGFEQVIATGAEIKDGVLTGRLGTQNCSGPEKTRRFLDSYPVRDTYVLYVYGDSRKDQTLLALADYPFYRRFL